LQLKIENSSASKCQFHQDFTRAFCTNIFCAKKLQNSHINVTREKLLKALSYQKFECKMLMKLTPFLHFRWCEEYLIEVKENKST